MLRRKQEVEREHEEINRRLNEQELAAKLMERRVKILEIEAGLYKADLREVNGE